MVLSVLCREHVYHFPAAAWTEGDTFQTPANMLAEGTHITHDKFRSVKHLGIDPLQDKVVFFGTQGNQKSVIDIAIAILFYRNDLTVWCELICYSDKIVQDFAFDCIDEGVSEFSGFGGQVGGAQSSGMVS